jgi:ABC-type multidrug transport system ATPase subunit
VGSSRNDYVDRIIDLLELEDIQDAIIGCLTVEQKKRVTIAAGGGWLRIQRLRG